MSPTPQTHENTRQFNAVFEILEKNNHDESRLIPILQQVQEVYRYLPPMVMSFIATSLGIPASRVYGVATFYSHFALKPKGKYIIRVCDGTACHVKGSTALVDSIRAHLKLGAGETTTQDFLFTLETVSCLGACGLAPVMVINETVHGQITPAQACSIIDSLKKSEARNDD
jgi:NADH-quinone oxidoreductase subunit E